MQCNAMQCEVKGSVLVADKFFSLCCTGGGLVN